MRHNLRRGTGLPRLRLSYTSSLPVHLRHAYPSVSSIVCIACVTCIYCKNGYTFLGLLLLTLTLHYRTASQPPKSRTKRFLLSQKDPNLSEARTLWTPISYSACSLINRLSKLTSRMVRIFPLLPYTDFIKVSRASEFGAPLPYSAAAFHTGSKLWS